MALMGPGYLQQYALTPSPRTAEKFPSLLACHNAYVDSCSSYTKYDQKILMLYVNMVREAMSKKMGIAKEKAEFPQHVCEKYIKIKPFI